MTHPNLQTNGASLEDCHTNFFALTELSGIKWRKLVWSDGNGGGLGSGGPFSNHHHQGHHQPHHHLHHQHQNTSPQDDPVLRSYARCLAADILCVWRRVAQPPPALNLFDGGGAVPSLPAASSLSAQPPPLSLAAAKELWIFWYGEEPDLGELVSPELLTPDSEQGSWESGLSYECRSLLFKALHNLIERCLLSRDFMRLGKWFVQPYEAPKKATEASPTHLSFSFAFFVHGESSVCASVDVRQHPPVRRLARLHLQQAAASATGLQVILAPFGLAGTLTGHTYKPTDTSTGTHLLDDWAQFYPVHTPTSTASTSPTRTSSNGAHSSNVTSSAAGGGGGGGGAHPLPPAATIPAATDGNSSVVEVIVGGVKMRYPAHYVLVTDMDDHVNGGVMSGVGAGVDDRLFSGGGGGGYASANGMGVNNGATTPLPTSSHPPSSHTFNPNTPPPSPSPPPPIPPTPTKVPQPGPHPVIIQHPNSMQRRTCVATALPESVWQECMLGGPPGQSLGGGGAGQQGSGSGVVPIGTVTPPHEGGGSGSWEFVDGMKRVQCTCSKCRKSKSGKSRGTSCLSSRIHRIPFHRRSSTPPLAASVATSIGNMTNTSSRADTATSSAERCSTNMGATPPTGGGPNTGGYTPHPPPTTPPSYPPRTQESVAVPSVGSPASAAPSPMANPASQSAPGSVPPPGAGSGTATGGGSAMKTECGATSEPTMPTLSPQGGHGHGHASGSACGNGTLAGTPDGPSTAAGGATTAPNSTVNSPMPLTSAILGADSKDSHGTLTPAIPLVLKRPTLTSKEYEMELGDDEHPLDMLYDYSTLDAWLNHPVKRFKPDTKQHFRNLAKNADLYSLYTPNGVTSSSELSSLKNGPQGSSPGQHHQLLTAATTTPMLPFIKTEIKQEPGLMMDMDGEDGTNSQLPTQGVKRPGDPYEFEDEGNNVDGFKRNANGSKEDPKKTGNLFTSEGLQPSYKDLDQIFDNSDTSSDEAVSFTQIQTPPGSNKSSTPHHDDTSTALSTTKQQRLSGGSSNSTQGSTCGTGGGSTMGGLRPEELSKMFPTPPSIPPIASPCGPNTDVTIAEMGDGGLMGVRVKQEQGCYPNMGSPLEENIEDWSYVFKPPTTFKLVGSSKYAPLTNLPSQSLPAVVLPSNCVYKPSWMQQQQQHAAEKSSQQHQQQQQQQQQQQATTTATTVAASAVAVTTTSAGVNLHGVGPMQMGGGMSNSLQQQRGSNNSTPTMLGVNQLPHHHHQHHHTLNNNVVFPPSPSPSMTPAGFRPPPPPYELPSPANSSTSNSAGGGAGPPYTIKPSLNSLDNNKQQSAISAAPPPEVNGLLVNVLLADTLLNIFRDHNFDSCTMCVCNAGVREVGDIRGADAGVYLTNDRTFSASGGALHTGSSGLDSPFGGGGGGSGGSNGPAPPPYGANTGVSSSAAGNVIAEYSGVGGGVAGGLEEEANRCSCGFSAVVNRRLSHRSGLFYEDEMQITGIAEDPGERKKSSLATYLLRNNPTTTKLEPGLDRDQLDVIPHSIMELLREQCVVIQSTANALHRSTRYGRGGKSHPHHPAMPYSNTVNALEYNDGNEVTTLALDQSRNAPDTVIKLEDGGHHHQQQIKMEPGSMRLYGTDRRSAHHPVHRWTFLRATGPQCNQDIVRVMKCLQPLLQEAIQKKCQARLWDAPSAVKGPLTWRQFHRLAGRGTVDRCEPQPIPSLLVGHEKDWLSLSPYALHHWESLLLEPYSYTRDVAYVVVAPDSDAILPRVRSFFRELSTAYEMCRLGRHVPITKVLRDGILRVGKTAKVKLGNEPVEEWFTLLGEGEMMDMLKLYAQVCKHHLAPHLQQVPMDKTLLDPPNDPTDKPAPSPMPPPSTPDNSQGMSDKAPSTPKSDQDGDSKDANFNSSSANGAGLSNGDSMHDDDEREPPAVLVYLVDPFSMGAAEERPELRRLAYLALLRCFQSLLAALPEAIRTNISVQIISQESIVELGRARERLRHSDHMRALALSIFSQCRRLLMHTNNVKSLTGFGTAAMADLFLKSKDEKNRLPYKLYTPPYVLAPLKDKAESAESFAQGSTEQASVLYLSYCLSEDQSWLLAVATDERGEIFETVTINIDIPNRCRRRKASARRIGLQKLMDFILGVMSQSVRPWRLVVGRVGRIGHGELKGWSWLLSRKHLLKASKYLKELCSQCSLLYPAAVPCILSACLVSLEPDSQLRLMPDQFTPDERFSLFSVNSQLATPQDLTCTHILVFPTSATTQSSQSAFHEAHINPDLGDEELFNVDDMPEGMDEMNDLNDIFDWDVNCGVQSPTGSPRPEESRPGSPGCHTSATGRPGSPSFAAGAPGAGGAFATAASLSPAEEVGTLLQQPLALGYYVSTAPTGRMPRWFWASCPHLEHVCPAFLKNALHMHSPNVQQNSDDLLLQQAAVTSHPLDSQYTTDVLRYVLEGYNALSWLALDSNTRDRLSCLPVHIQVLTQLYHTTATLL